MPFIWVGCNTGGVRRILQLDTNGVTDRRRESRGKDIHSLPKDELQKILFDVNQTAPNARASIQALSRTALAGAVWDALVSAHRIIAF